VLSAALAFALVWTFPLVQSPGGRILGAGAGDNVTFLWNLWWMRQAIADPSLDFFHCELIFAPWGTPLVLHTHTALPAFIAATLLRPLPLALAQNSIIWAALAANLCAMYALALQRTGDRQASFAGALVFAGSPFLVAHLHGHWNLVHLWPLPLVVLATSRATKQSRGTGDPPYMTGAWAAATGVLLAITAYTDYYIALFAAVLFAMVVADRLVAVSTTIQTRRWTLLAGLFAALAAIAFVLALAIHFSGGTSLGAGTLRISVRTVTNPLRAAWIALIAAALALWRPGLRLAWRDEASRRRAIACMTVASGVGLVLVAPLLWHAAHLIAAGDYASETWRWRSGPRGVDVATILLGSPFHPVVGPHVGAAYRALGLDPIEQIGWMGVAPVVLAIFALRRRRQDSLKWGLLWLGAVVWSFGAFLSVAGVDIGLPLPQIVQRFLPIVSNARMPGRVMAVAFLALAMLTAIGTAALRERLRPGAARVAGAALCAAVLVDFWPAPFPTMAPDTPAVYADVAVLGDGPVAELPLGIRDGFGEQGRLDHAALYHQSVHGRPMVGGFVARLSPSLRSRYLNEPIISSLLKLSGGVPLSTGERVRDRHLARGLLQQWKLRVFIVDTREASGELVGYLEEVLAARRAFGDGVRDVYVVAGPGMELQP
jgi:hypothetical protein